ncbi:hypothetical protein GJ744_008730 [Endocarpon pusillum]|uniref:Uncharacterized protein n=1 Tax=Endocarpon pusillum TaxID=364733 RepID=A0A8H7AUJ5_9EURO|nr:hypothetical protein GJ744_008730 [Endocarpon pusillum]
MKIHDDRKRFAAESSDLHRVLRPSSEDVLGSSIQRRWLASWKKRDGFTTPHSGCVASHQPSPSFASGGRFLGNAGGPLGPNPAASNLIAGILPRPETRPITKEQLVNSLIAICPVLDTAKEICVEIDQQQATPSSKLTKEQWEASIALLLALLADPHGFFLAGQYPSASTPLGRRTTKNPVMFLQDLADLLHSLWKPKFSGLSVQRQEQEDPADWAATRIANGFLTFPPTFCPWIHPFSPNALEYFALFVSWKSVTVYLNARGSHGDLDRQHTYAFGMIAHDERPFFDKLTMICLMKSLFARPRFEKFMMRRLESALLEQKPPEGLMLRSCKLLPSRRHLPRDFMPPAQLLSVLRFSLTVYSPRGISSLQNGETLLHVESKNDHSDCSTEQMQNITASRSNPPMFPFTKILRILHTLVAFHSALCCLPIALAQQESEPSSIPSDPCWIGAVFLLNLGWLSVKATKGNPMYNSLLLVWISYASLTVWHDLDAVIQCLVVVIGVAVLATGLHQAEKRRQGVPFRTREIISTVEEGKAYSDGDDPDDGGTTNSFDWKPANAQFYGLACPTTTSVQQSVSDNGQYDGRENSPESEPWNGTVGFQHLG